MRSHRTSVTLGMCAVSVPLTSKREQCYKSRGDTVESRPAGEKSSRLSPLRQTPSNPQPREA